MADCHDINAKAYALSSSTSAKSSSPSRSISANLCEQRSTLKRCRLPAGHDARQQHNTECNIGEEAQNDKEQFDFDSWIVDKGLQSVKTVFVDHNMTSLDTLSTTNADYVRLIDDQRLLQQPQLLRVIAAAIRSLQFTTKKVPNSVDKSKSEKIESSLSCRSPLDKAVLENSANTKRSSKKTVKRKKRKLKSTNIAYLNDCVTSTSNKKRRIEPRRSSNIVDYRLIMFMKRLLDQLMLQDSVHLTQAGKEAKKTAVTRIPTDVIRNIVEYLYHFRLRFRSGRNVRIGIDGKSVASTERRACGKWTTFVMGGRISKFLEHNTIELQFELRCTGIIEIGLVEHKHLDLLNRDKSISSNTQISCVGIRRNIRDNSFRIINTQKNQSSIQTSEFKAAFAVSEKLGIVLERRGSHWDVCFSVSKAVISEACTAMMQDICIVINLHNKGDYVALKRVNFSNKFNILSALQPIEK